MRVEGGQPASVIVDCGTARTWLRLDSEGAEEFVADAYTARLGGQRMVLLGRRVPPFEETNGALPVIGAVGNDYLLAATTIIDLPKGTLTRVPSGSVVPGSDKWPSLPFETSHGVITLDAHLDGQMRHLLLDTGAPSSILLRDPGREGDGERTSTDVHGNPLEVKESSSSLQLPGAEPRTVSLWRMQTFPHLENVGTAIGQPLDGILGLSSLGQKRIVLDGAANRLMLEP